MDYLDLAIIGLLIIFAISGYRRGLSWVALSLLGLLLGLVLGAVFAPKLAHAFSDKPGVTSLIAVGIFLSFVVLIQGIGAAVGFRVRVASLKTGFARWDSFFGALLAAFGMLVGTWYLGLTFSQSPWVGLDDQISGSGILRALDGVVPRPPSFLASIENILRGSNSPNPFSSIVNGALPPLKIPPLVDTSGIRHAAFLTEKVVAFGCGGGEAGSSWPVANHYLVTNAHVVAGSTRVEIDSSDGASHPATVVFFDPNVDVAVLYVPGLTVSPLNVLNNDPDRGTNGAVIGYPNGESEAVVAAAVRGTEQAMGYNIYSDSLVTRDIEVLAAHVIPGDSGGPLVDTGGTVIGMVFAESTKANDEAYALTIPQITPALQQAAGRTRPVPTLTCAA